MWTIVKAALALGSVSAMALGTTAPVKAQGFEMNVPGIHVHGAHHRNYSDQRVYDYAPGEAHPSWNGSCPQGYAIQAGVCKLYRAH